MPKYRNYTIEDITHAVATSKSLAEVCRRLDLVPIGGNYKTIKLHIARLNLSTLHFKRVPPVNKGTYKSLDKLHSNAYLKKALIRERGHQCGDCGNTRWKGVPIPLELEHADGDTTNNAKDNLFLLCPNCHALTPTYRRKKSSLGGAGGIRTHTVRNGPSAFKTA
jgi:hypothetical protein